MFNFHVRSAAADIFARPLFLRSTFNKLTRAVICFSVLTAGLCSMSVSAQPRDKLVDACELGSSSNDRTTCLKESAAAKGEAKRGQLSSPDAAFEANALDRCKVLPQADKELCQSRIQGNGKTEGSVNDGGMLREITTPNSNIPVPSTHQ